MRTRMEVANIDFVTQLANYASQKKIEPKVILAAENGMEEKATQSAVAYYMLGWHWDEIASVLEDMGYPEKDIDGVMERARIEIEDKLKDGPFSVLQYGQFVKLNNGEFGKLVDKREKFITVVLPEEKVDVVEQQVDFAATAALTEAYTLRANAHSVLKKYAQEDDYEDLGKRTEFRVLPDPQETGPAKGYDWPKSVPSEDPQTGEKLTIEDMLYLQQELGHSLTLAVHQIMELSREIDQEKRVIEKETSELNAQLRNVRESKAEHETQMTKLIEEVLNNVEQVYGVTQEQYTYVMNYLNRIVILHQRIVEPKPRVDLKYVAEYEAFYEKMLDWANNQPARIRDMVLNAMEEVKSEVIQQPRPMWKRVFELIWPTKERRKTSQDAFASIWNAVTSWASRAFKAVQDFYASWHNAIKPEIEDQINQVDEFIAQEEALDRAAGVQETVAALVKRYK